MTPRDLAKPEVFELRAFTSTELSPQLSRGTKSPRQPMAHLVQVAQRVETHSEYLGQDESMLAVGPELTSPVPAPNRRVMARPSMPAPERRTPQETQLLALRKVHLDVVIVRLSDLYQTRSPKRHF